MAIYTIANDALFRATQIGETAIKTDGVSGYASIPFNPNVTQQYWVEVEFSRSVWGGTVFSTSTLTSNTVSIFADAGGQLNVQLRHTGGTTTYNSPLGILQLGVNYLVKVEVTPNVKMDVFINGALVGTRAFTQNVIASTTTVGYLGALPRTPVIGFGKNDVTKFSSSLGYTYIKNGDQTSGAVVPSTPSGADGSVVSPAVWGYETVEGNYLTQQLLIAAVPNPAGHVVEVLDRSTPVDLLLAGGYTVQYTYAPSGGNGAYGYNVLNMGLSLGL